MATLSPGSQFGEYRIEREIARGGMGIVYQATRVRTGQSIALKVIAAERAAEREYRERFVREAQVLVGLRHPRIVPLIDWGEVDGTLYLALAYLDGPNLEDLIEREGPFSLGRTVELLAPVAEALDAAHRRGYVHRDVKPANVMLDGDGNVYLTDFGLGKLAASSGLSATNTTAGTLAYMAPEQFTGKAEPARAGQIDIYALGCVFHACLTRQDVVPTDSYARTVHAVVYEPPPTLTSIRPSLPVDIDAVEGRALAKNPADRYETAAAFIGAARAVLLANPEPAPGSVPVPPPARPADRQPIAAVADLTALQAGAAGATVVAAPPGAATEIAPSYVAASLPAGIAAPPPAPVGSAAGAARVATTRNQKRVIAVSGVAIAAVVLVGGALALGGSRAPQATDRPAVALGSPAATRVVPASIRPIITPTPRPTPTPTDSPTPTPSIGVGQANDPAPVIGTWPTAEGTVLKWIPAAIRPSCTKIDPTIDESTAFVCGVEAIDAFKGHDILAVYSFFKTESDVRAAYDGLVNRNYDRGDTCATGEEVTWSYDTGGADLGRILCENTDYGYAQIYQTYYGKPVLLNLFRKGQYLKIIADAWADAGSDIDPDTGSTKPH